MASSLAQTTIPISLVIILLATTTLVHASMYRSYPDNTPTWPSNYNPVQGFQQPYYTQPNPNPTYQTPSYYNQPQPNPTNEGSPYSGSDSDKETFLQTQNAARASVGLPPFTWDDTVAAFAQNWANQRINDCRLVHSGSADYGENIFWGSGDYSVAFAVQTWVGERKYYDLYSNSCAGGMDCGHWTQIVWRTSTRLGCAKVRCSNGGVFITCNYDPPGNYIGSRPY